MRVRIGRLYLETFHKELFEKRVNRWYNAKDDADKASRRSMKNGNQRWQKVIFQTFTWSLPNLTFLTAIIHVCIRTPKAATRGVLKEKVLWATPSGITTTVSVLMPLSRLAGVRMRLFLFFESFQSQIVLILFLLRSCWKES